MDRFRGSGQKYAYYPTNNVKTITDAVNTGNSQSFVYDNLQRLSAAAGGYGAYGYTYDNNGNRLTQTLRRDDELWLIGRNS